MSIWNGMIRKILIEKGAFEQNLKVKDLAMWIMRFIEWDWWLIYKII